MNDAELIRLRQWAVAQATTPSWVGFPGGIDSCALSVVHLIEARDELMRLVDTMTVPASKQSS